MAWVFECQMDREMIRADTKEALADKVMHHANDKHHMDIDHNRAMQMVNESGRQTP